MMHDPIDELKASLAQGGFSEKHAAVLRHFIEKLAEARTFYEAPLKPHERQAYRARRLEQWELLTAEDKMPAFTAEDLELARYADALFTLFADAEFIPNGYRAGTLRTSISAAMSRALEYHEDLHPTSLRHAEIGDDFRALLRDFEHMLEGPKAFVATGHAGGITGR